MFWKQRDSFREKETRQQEMSANAESYVKFIKETVLVGLQPQQKTEIEKLIERDFSIYERLLKELEDYKFDKYIKVLSDSIEEWQTINRSQTDKLDEWISYFERARKDETLKNNLIKTVEEDMDKTEKLFGTPKNEFEREIKDKFLDNRRGLKELLLAAKELKAKAIRTMLSYWQMAILSVQGEIDSAIRKKQFYRFAIHCILISTAILLTVLTFYNITLLPITIVVVIISYPVDRWVTLWLEKQFKLKLSKIFFLILLGKIKTKLDSFIPRKEVLDGLSRSHEDTYEHGTNKVS
jgi:hypothetical protein